MRVEQVFAKTGYFWLPDTPEKKIPGTLTIEDGGRIELEIVGRFYNDIKSIHEENTFDRIIGEIEHDGYITLDHCFYLQKNLSFGNNISKSTLYVHKALSGVAYDKDEGVTFNSVSFSMDCLDEWIHISGFSVETVLESYVTTIKYIRPEKISFFLTNGMELEISFSHTFPLGTNITEAKITQKAYFNLKSEELRPLDDFVNIIYKVTHFICFATDEIVSIKNLQAKSNNIQQEISAEKKISIPILLYYQSLPFSEKIPKKSWKFMLFTFKDIESNAQNIFNCWIDAYDTLSPAFNLYFSTKSKTKKYLEEQFLGLIQGLETYHRRSSRETFIEQDKFDVLVTEIKSY